MFTQDFRSSDGLYALDKQTYPNVLLKGRDLFDADLFRDPTSTSVFYTFVSELKRSIDAATPSLTHRSIKILDAKKRLLRSYTQNIVCSWMITRYSNRILPQHWQDGVFDH